MNLMLSLNNQVGIGEETKEARDSRVKNVRTSIGI